MKKLKILPSILMLVLCVGVLAVGVFAITPTENTITGTITIDSTNAPVTMKVYKDTLQGEELGKLEETRAGDTLNLSNAGLEFVTTDANIVSDVPAVVLVIEFSTTSTARLVIDTETIEYFDGVKTSGGTIENLASVTKMHTPGMIDEDNTGLACFTAGSNYVIKCTFRLGSFVNEEVTINYDLTFNICKAIDYEGDGINGVDYLNFGSFPQTASESTTGFNKLSKTFGSYDDTTGGMVLRDVYEDSEGNEYVLYNSVYYQIEPLRWRILTAEDGTALLMCENIVEQVCFRKNYVSEKEGTTTYYYATEDGTNPLEIEGTKIYANNYAYSDLRAYLNQTFYTYAFNDLQKQLIPQTELNNKTGEQEEKDFVLDSITKNPYAEATANTTDYVFALSYDQIVNAEKKTDGTYYDYGFAPLLSSGENIKDDNVGYYLDIARMIKNTGYSTATGAYTNSTYETVEELTADCDNEETIAEWIECGYGAYSKTNAESDAEFLEYFSNTGWWWSRSPNPTLSSYASGVNDGGNANSGSTVNSTSAGCVPALRLSLEG